MRGGAPCAASWQAHSLQLLSLSPESSRHSASAPVSICTHAWKPVKRCAQLTGAPLPEWGHLSQQDLIPVTTVLRIKDSIIPSYEAPGAAQWQKKLIHTLHISLVPGKANVILFFLQIRKSETQRGEITCPVPQLVNSQSNTY